MSREVIAHGEDDMELVAYDSESYRVEQPATGLCSHWLAVNEVEDLELDAAVRGCFRAMHLEIQK